MIELTCDAVLLDIEGTVSPVTFVVDVMFPFVRRDLNRFLDENWESADVQQAVELIAKDIGQPSAEQWLGDTSAFEQQQLVALIVNDLMDQDSKQTGLKQLQGLVWRSGFANGELVSSLFDDVLPRLKLWRQSGISLYIYSSGSVGAQKLFFGHTTDGDLLDLFSDFFDTHIGKKNDPGSYSRIAETIGLDSSKVLFISDSQMEIEAANLAGMQTVWRPAEAQARTHRQQTITSFAELRLSK